MEAVAPSFHHHHHHHQDNSNSSNTTSGRDFLVLFLQAQAVSFTHSPCSCNEHNNALATETRLYLARLTLEYQQLGNLYGLCLPHLQDAARESEILGQENAKLRMANKDLMKRFTILTQASVQNRYLSSNFPSLSIINDFRGLCVGDNGGGGPNISTVIFETSHPTPWSVTNNRPRAGTPPIPYELQRVYVLSEGTMTRDHWSWDAYNQGMLKTELCNKWQETGAFPYGEHCQLAHGIGELRPVIHHPRYRTEVYRMVLSGDTCPYGHRCHFCHALTEKERLMHGGS